MYEKNGNINKETENLTRNQKQILELKNTVTSVKISVQVFKGRFKQEEKRISELEDNEYYSLRNRKEKGLNKREQNLRDLWDTSKGPLSPGEERIFEEWLKISQV